MGKDEHLFTEQSEEFSQLQPKVTAVSQKIIEVGWKPVSSSHFKKVRYSVFLDGKKIADGLNATRYSFTNLNPGQNYSLKVLASTAEEKLIEESQLLEMKGIKTEDFRSMVPSIGFL